MIDGEARLDLDYIEDSAADLTDGDWDEAPRLPAERLEPNVASFFPPPQRIRSLRHGCYLLRYTPKSASMMYLYHYDGTMRVQRAGFTTIASGAIVGTATSPPGSGTTFTEALLNVVFG